MREFVEIQASKRSWLQRKPVRGVGINDAAYMVTIREDKKITGRCPFYEVWDHMLLRCYDDKFQKKYKTYKGCSVTKDWLLFSAFKKWMKLQDWKGNHLDKDLKYPGNKIYSPETCFFVSSALNNLLTDNSAKRGRWPIGVCFHKVSNKFQSECSHNGKTVFLGLFDTPEPAHLEYVKYKSNIIQSLIPSNPALKLGLELAIKNLKKGLNA